MGSTLAHGEDWCSEFNWLPLYSKYGCCFVQVSDFDCIMRKICLEYFIAVGHDKFTRMTFIYNCSKLYYVCLTQIEQYLRDTWLKRYWHFVLLKCSDVDLGRLQHPTDTFPLWSLYSILQSLLIFEVFQRFRGSNDKRVVSDKIRVVSVVSWWLLLGRTSKEKLNLFQCLLPYYSSQLHHSSGMQLNPHLFFSWSP